MISDLHLKWWPSIARVKAKSGFLAPDQKFDERFILTSLSEAQFLLQEATGAVKERDIDIALTGASSYTPASHIGTIRNVEFIGGGSTQGVNVTNTPFATQQAVRQNTTTVVGDRSPRLTYNYENGVLYVYPAHSTGTLRIRHIPIITLYDSEDTTGYWATFNAYESSPGVAASFEQKCKAFGPEQALSAGVVGMEAYALIQLLDQARDMTQATFSMRQGAAEQWDKAARLVARRNPTQTKHTISPSNLGHVR